MRQDYSIGPADETGVYLRIDSGDYQGSVLKISPTELNEEDMSLKSHLLSVCFNDKFLKEHELTDDMMSVINEIIKDYIVLMIEYKNYQLKRDK